jgi:putative acetyltransferase
MTNVRTRLISPDDDPSVAALIRAVLPEFVGDAKGTPLDEPEVDAMSATFSQPGAAYRVLERGGHVEGGGGFLPFAEGTCELQKLYLLSYVRGQGFGRRLLEELLAAAREAGYERCVLQTTATMVRAQALYAAGGFQRLEEPPAGANSHSCCEAWFGLDL